MPVGTATALPSSLVELWRLLREAIDIDYSDRQCDPSPCIYLGDMKWGAWNQQPEHILKYITALSQRSGIELSVTERIDYSSGTASIQIFAAGVPGERSTVYKSSAIGDRGIDRARFDAMFTALAKLAKDKQLQLVRY